MVSSFFLFFSSNNFSLESLLLLIGDHANIIGLIVEDDSMFVRCTSSHNVVESCALFFEESKNEEMQATEANTATNEGLLA